MNIDENQAAAVACKPRGLITKPHRHPLTKQEIDQHAEDAMNNLAIEQPLQPLNATLQTQTEESRHDDRIYESELPCTRIAGNYREYDYSRLYAGTLVMVNHGRGHPRYEFEVGQTQEHTEKNRQIAHATAVRRNRTYEKKAKEVREERKYQDKTRHMYDITDELSTRAEVYTKHAQESESAIRELENARELVKEAADSMQQFEQTHNELANVYEKFLALEWHPRKRRGKTPRVEELLTSSDSSKCQDSDS
jgi:hypothetical protein